MNIWIFNHYAKAPGSSGGSRHYDLAKYLKKNGHNVTIFAASFHHQQKEEMLDEKESYRVEDYDGVQFVWIKTLSYYNNGLKRAMNMVNYFTNSLKVYKLIDETPNIVIGSLVHPLAAYLGYHVAKNKNCLFYFEERDLWPQTLIDLGKFSKKNPAVMILDKLELFLYKRAQRIIVLFDKAPDYVKSRGIKENKILYLPNGIDLERFANTMDNAPQDIEDLYAEIENKFIVVYVGSHGIPNHLDPIVDTAKLLLNNENVHFVFIGTGSEKERLQNRSQQEGINNITFTSPISKDYIPYVLEKSSLGIISMKDSPLYKWGFSMNKLYDYMAAGLPVILHYNGPFNVIEQSRGINKVINSDEAATTIEHISEGNYDYPIMSQGSRDYVEKYHSWERLAEYLEKVMFEDLKVK
ncbi:glycosyltransferase family 4 protein [Salibacterium halotolerans]|nr:glycosyltransferase family 4 protein [Salibacterium halotolerans]